MTQELDVDIFNLDEVERFDYKEGGNEDFNFSFSIFCEKGEKARSSAIKQSIQRKVQKVGIQKGRQEQQYEVRRRDYEQPYFLEFVLFLS